MSQLLKMNRKKPFSGKAKKEQLQAKREAKKEKEQEEERQLKPPREGAGRSSRDSHTDGDGEKEEVTGVRARLEVLRVHDQPRPGKEHNPNRYRLHFARENDVEVEKRKAWSRQPLEILPQTALEVSFEDVHRGGKVPDFPRRPHWDYGMSREELDAKEQKAFDQWVDGILDKYGDEVSYFEINLETWRQLWRVLEISDVIMLLTDIRHPVIHFPPALYKYIVEEQGREMVLIFNKIDLVTPATVEAWRKYFVDRFPKLHVASFTSYPNEKISHVEEVFKKKRGRMRKSRLMAWGQEQVLAACEACHVTKHGQRVSLADWRTKVGQQMTQHQQQLAKERRQDMQEEEVYTGGTLDEEFMSDSDEENVETPELSTLADTEEGPHKDFVTIGVVGYPNVGKSSVLNGLMGKKVVSCSRTPGHTKHFQTIFLTPTVRLCDSPGIVFPSLVPKQLQILSGIFPVSQVREPYSCVGFMAQRLPLLEILRIDWPYEDDEVPKELASAYKRARGNDRPWSAWAICDGWAKKRGYLTAKAGRLDTYRAANSLLRLACDGRIVLSFKPPGFFENIHESVDIAKQRALLGEEGEAAASEGKGKESESESEEEVRPKGRGHIGRHVNAFDLLADQEEEEED